MRRRNEITGLIFAALFLVLQTASWSFTISVPDEIAEKPEEERIEWLKNETEEAKREQIRVGEERYEARMNEKQRVIADMNKAALVRRQKIQAAQEARIEERKDAAARSKSTSFFAFMIIFPLAVIGFIHWRNSSRVRVPMMAHKESFEALKGSQDLMMKLKKKQSNTKRKTK